MRDLVITLVRVRCDEATDDFLEGLTDEFGWRICGFDAAGDQSAWLEEIPMEGMESVEAGSEHTLNRELARLGPESLMAQLEFWDKDTFGSDDLLGLIEVRRDGEDGLTVTAGTSTEALGDGAFRLTGEAGDYTVWLTIEVK